MERRTLSARRDAPCGPKPVIDRTGLSRAPAPTAETAIPEEDETEGLFGAAAVGAIIRRTPVTAKAESPDNTVGAGLAPARGRGQTTEPLGGASPSPTAEDEGKTVADLERRESTSEAEAPKPPKSKKKQILLVCSAVAAILIGLLILKTVQDKRAEAAERAGSVRRSQLCCQRS